MALDNIITAFKLFNQSKKKIAAITNFQFVNANQLRAITLLIRWRDTVLQFWVDCTKFINTHRQLYHERNQTILIFIVKLFRVTWTYS